MRWPFAVLIWGPNSPLDPPVIPPIASARVFAERDPRACRPRGFMNGDARIRRIIVPLGRVPAGIAAAHDMSGASHRRPIVIAPHCAGSATGAARCTAAGSGASSAGSCTTGTTGSAAASLSHSHSRPAGYQRGGQEHTYHRTPPQTFIRPRLQSGASVTVPIFSGAARSSPKRRARLFPDRPAEQPDGRAAQLHEHPDEEREHALEQHQNGADRDEIHQRVGKE